MKVTLAAVRLSSAEAVLMATVELLTPDAVLTGRLVGPVRDDADTIQMAYPFREVSRTNTTAEFRAVVPEPNFAPARYVATLTGGDERAEVAVVFRAKN